MTSFYLTLLTHCVFLYYLGQHQQQQISRPQVDQSNYPIGVIAKGIYWLYTNKKYLPQKIGLRYVEWIKKQWKSEIFKMKSFYLMILRPTSFARFWKQNVRFAVLLSVSARPTGAPGNRSVIRMVNQPFSKPANEEGLNSTLGLGRPDYQNLVLNLFSNFEPLS